MSYFKIIWVTLLLNLLVLTSSAQQRSRVEVIFAKTLEGNTKSVYGSLTKLIGNVQLKQGSTLMFCDSALLYDDSNKLEAFSNVKIVSNDTITIIGEYLRYNGNEKKAYIERNVVLTDPSINLTTQQLDYDLSQSYGYYAQEGTIVNKQQTTLKSQMGYYYAQRKEFFFKKKVSVVNPNYTMYSDTLMYNTFTKISYFYGPTTILSKTDKIICENGWYNTSKEQAQFSKNAVLISENKILKADSLYYDGKLKLGRAFRNVDLFDSAQDIRLLGDFGENNGKTKRSYVAQNPYAIKLMDKKDSMFLYADTLYLYQRDKKQKQRFEAYHSAKIFKSDMQAICDSMVYMQDDSVLWLYKSPIMWTGENQITSDTIKFFINNSRLDSFYLLNNSFTASKVKGQHFNQVKGRNMRGYFDSSNIKHIKVFGNGQSIYYAKEDSVNYVGVNVIDCSEMEFHFVNKVLSKTVFNTKPDATMYPLDEQKPEMLRLKGFKWHDKLRPKRLNNKLLSKFYNKN